MEKSKTPGGAKPVPMKLFATWEVDRTPSNCIPRLCSLSLNRLMVGGTGLGNDVSSLTIAVKVQGSKRTLRSNEMALQSDGKLDTELQLNFSLQYPHLLKRQGNKLHVMLQRRKRYKNRTILGYKTLAEGTLDMSLVLQREMDLELDLVNGKDGKNVLGRVSVICLNSQPVDYEGTKGGRGEFSDEEEEYSSNDDMSDSEQELTSRPNQVPNRATAHQNLKQKFIALLKKFKINEESLIPERKGVDPAEIADLFDELEDMSDSGGEVDTVSITSTPKPSLRPFFSSTRSLLTSGDSPAATLHDTCNSKKDSDSHNDSDPTPSSSPPKLVDDSSKTAVSTKESSLSAKKKILRDKASGFLQDYSQDPTDKN